MRYAAADELDLIRRAQSGDRKASGLLVESMMALIHREARAQSRRCGEPLDDLIQVASIGVLDAIQRFDAARGCRLITVALVRIRTALRPTVRRSQSDQRRQVALDDALEPVSDDDDPSDAIDSRGRAAELLDVASRVLTPREHLILRRYTADRAESFEQIGKSLRLSREAVRLDYESAVRKIRANLCPVEPMTAAALRAPRA